MSQLLTKRQNFGPAQSKGVCRRRFESVSNDGICLWWVKKHTDKKEKILVPSIFSFSQYTIKSCPRSQNSGLFGTESKPSFSKGPVMYRENTNIVFPYIKKYLTRLGEFIIFEPWVRYFWCTATLYMYSMYSMYSIYLWTPDLFSWVSLFLTPSNMKLAVYGIGSAVVMTSWIRLTAS